MTTPDLTIRWSVASDLATLLQIENAAFRYPWDITIIRAALQDRDTVSVVAVDEKDQVKGHAVYRLHPEGLCLLRFAVHPKCQRQGVGTAIINSIKAKISRRKPRVFALVPDDKLHVHLFLRSLGFRAIRVHRNGFMRNVDGYEMEYRVNTDTHAKQSACRR